MNTYYLALTVVVEISLAYLTITKKACRLEWGLGRAAASLFEVWIFLIVRMSMGSAADFRYKPLFAVLLLRITISFIYYGIIRVKIRGFSGTQREHQAKVWEAVKAGDESGQQKYIAKLHESDGVVMSPLKVTASCILGIVVIGLSLIPSYVFTDYSGSETIGAYEAPSEDTSSIEGTLVGEISVDDVYNILNILKEKVYED